MATRSKMKSQYRKENADRRPHATAKHIRISSRKVKIVIDLIRGKKVDEALAILKKHGERTEMRYEAPVLSPNMPPIPLSTAPLEIPTRCGGVVLFVLDVAQSARY